MDQLQGSLPMSIFTTRLHALNRNRIHFFNPQFPKLDLVPSRCSINLRHMHKETNSVSRLDKMTQGCLQPEILQLIIPTSALNLSAVVQGPCNSEASRQRENIMGSSGIQPFKALSLSCSIPSSKNTPMWPLGQMLLTPF